MAKAGLVKFLDYLNDQVKNGSIYLWGGQGEDIQKCTDKYIKAKETSLTNAKRVIKLKNARLKAGKIKAKAFDCSGLSMYWLLKEGYRATDTTADGLRKTCTTIAKSKLKKGDWVFRVKSGKAYHIGYVYDNDLNVIESYGRDKGVIKRTLNAGGSTYWNAFGRPSYFKTEIEYKPATPVKKYEFNRLLKYKTRMMRGTDVKNLQYLLKKSGISAGSIDGVFGKNTRNAVRLFQKANSLTVDGIVGKNTVEALGGIWKK